MEGVRLGDTGDAVIEGLILWERRDAETLLEGVTEALTDAVLEDVAEEDGVRLGEGRATTGSADGEGTPTIAAAAGNDTPVQFPRSAKVAFSAEAAALDDPYRFVCRFAIILEPHEPLESTQIRANPRVDVMFVPFTPAPWAPAHVVNPGVA